MPCAVAVGGRRRIVVFQDVVLEAAMVSWLEELGRGVSVKAHQAQG